MPYSDSRSTEAVLGRMLAERESRLDALQARLDELERAAAENRESAEVLRRLIHDLAWPDGPRALRAVLPLARLIRRLSRR